MKENGIAKTIRTVGIIEIVCGAIGGFITLTQGDYFIAIGIAAIATSAITCLMLFGFAEIIDLLHNNVDRQNQILDYLRDKAVKEKNAPKTVIQDIEDNLPDM